VTTTATSIRHQAINAATNDGHAGKCMPVAATVRAAAYGRVSTDSQSTDPQLSLLRAHAASKGYELTEYVDHAISGAKDRRPALDRLMQAVRARDVDVLAVTKIDRLARSLRHLLAVAHELEENGVDLVVLDGQAIDTTTPAGKLTFQILGAIAEFERTLIVDRVKAGLRHAQKHGTRSGRPIGRAPRSVDLAAVARMRADGRSYRAIAMILKIPARTIWRHANANGNGAAFPSR
jgi:DNA invertase Pin-like site-specific DNA recombinase